MLGDAGSGHERRGGLAGHLRPDFARIAGEHLEQAGSDLLGAMVKTFAGALMGAEGASVGVGLPPHLHQPLLVDGHGGAHDEADLGAACADRPAQLAVDGRAGHRSQVVATNRGPASR